MGAALWVFNCFSFLSSKSHFSNFVFKLESHKALVIEHLAGLPSIESEVSVAEVREDYNACEQEHPGVVALALFLEGVVAQLVAVGLVVHLRVLVEVQRVGVP